MQVLTALSGATEAMMQQSLKQDVDTIVDAIRAEVAVADGREADLAIEDAIQVYSASQPQQQVHRCSRLYC